MLLRQMIVVLTTEYAEAEHVVFQLYFIANINSGCSR